MLNIHSKLMEKNTVYNKWHNHSLSNLAHFAVFIVTALLLVSVIQNTVEAQTGGGVEPGPTTLDIIFVGDNYDISEMGKFRNDVERFKSELLKFEPFKSQASQITFDYIENTKDLKCSGSRNLICDTTLVNNVINSSGKVYDEKVVIVDTNVYGGSGWIFRGHTTAYNGSLGPRMFVHEFAHKFGSLADEYVESGVNSNTTINCSTSKPSNNNFKNHWAEVVPLDDYTLGCGKSYLYRSSVTSIMKDLNVPYFNPVSQRALSNVMTFRAPFWGGVDTIAPQVGTISTSGTSGQITISAPMSDNYGVAYATLLVDGELKQVAYQAPFNFTWDSTKVSNGEHTLQIKAYDTAKRVGLSPVATITIDNTATPVTPPAEVVPPSITEEVGTQTIFNEESVFISSQASKYAEFVPNPNYSTTVGFQSAKAVLIKGDTWNKGQVILVSPVLNSDFSKYSYIEFMMKPYSGEATGRNFQLKSYYGDSKEVGMDNYLSAVGDGWYKVIIPITDLAGGTKEGGVNKVQYLAFGPANNYLIVDDIKLASQTTGVTDITAPQVVITSPTNGQTVKDTVRVEVNTSDDSGTVSKVEIYKNNVLEGTDITSPFYFDWLTDKENNGKYTLTAKAYDQNNNVGTSAPVEVTVYNSFEAIASPSSPAQSDEGGEDNSGGGSSSDDTSLPAVELTTPSDGDTVSGKILLKAEPTSGSGPVTQVWFYVNDKLLYPDRTAPFTVSWLTNQLAGDGSRKYPDGEYTLKAVAYNEAGDKVDSETISVTVSNALSFNLKSFSLSNIFQALNNLFNSWFGWWDF